MAATLVVLFLAPGPELSKRLLDLAEYAAKLVTAALVVWGLVEKVGKPFSDWRKKRLGAELREILKPELDKLAALATCTDALERVHASLHVLFEELDEYLAIVHDQQERIDETNELLDEVFHVDRRANTERRIRTDELLSKLRRRQLVRRRQGEDAPPAGEARPS